MLPSNSPLCVVEILEMRCHYWHKSCCHHLRNINSEKLISQTDKSQSDRLVDLVRKSWVIAYVRIPGLHKVSYYQLQEPIQSATHRRRFGVEGLLLVGLSGSQGGGLVPPSCRRQESCPGRASYRVPFPIPAPSRCEHQQCDQAQHREHEAYNKGVSGPA